MQLGIADIVYDALFYARTGAPREVDGVLSACASSNGAPPSIEAAIREFTSRPDMRLHLEATGHSPVIASAFVDACAGAIADCTPVGDLGMVPISTVEWENQQLRWNRSVNGYPIPACEYDDECVGLRLPCAPGPLQVYLSPDEEARAGAGEKVDSGMCLLCMRANYEALYQLHTPTVVNSALQTGRPLFVVPPFQNLVDCPGGCLLYTSPSPRDYAASRMPSSA